MHSVLVIIPTFNEIENIEPILSQVFRNAQVDILVVDDNSPDGTALRVKKLQPTYPDQLHLMNREKKDGLAAAYIAGIQWGLERSYDVLIEMDADFSHSPRDLPRMLEMLQSADVAVGSRYIPGGGTPGWSLIRQGISRGGNIYAKLVLGVDYQDLTGGFNGWKRPVLESIDVSTIQSKGYSFQVEMKYRAHQKGFRIEEFPIQFHSRIHGYSKMSGGIFWEAAWNVLKMRSVFV